jgi:RNA polymerase sigma-70 factor (ECF subfamily)
MAGGSDDWTAWLRQHGAALVLLARQWGLKHADAEDAVQDAFVRFWRRRHRAADPTAYLYACVKHSALDHLRGRTRRARREKSTARPEADGYFAGSIERDERRRAVEAALMSLPQEQREVLVMKIWGGLSFPQIGEALCVPSNTAASRYRYALAKLEIVLSEESIS